MRLTVALQIFRIYRDIRFSPDPTPYKVRPAIPPPLAFRQKRKRNSGREGGVGERRAAASFLPPSPRPLQETYMMLMHAPCA